MSDVPGTYEPDVINTQVDFSTESFEDLLTSFDWDSVANIENPLSGTTDVTFANGLTTSTSSANLFRKKDRALVQQSWMETVMQLKTGIANSLSAAFAAVTEAQGAVEAARLDAGARCQEAYLNYLAVCEKSETDLAIVEKEAEVEFEKLEVEREKIELEKYRIDNEGYWRAQAEYEEALGERIEAEGNYAYDIARAESEDSGSSWGWS